MLRKIIADQVTITEINAASGGVLDPKLRNKKPDEEDIVF